MPKHHKKKKKHLHKEKKSKHSSIKKDLISYYTGPAVDESSNSLQQHENLVVRDKDTDFWKHEDNKESSSESEEGEGPIVVSDARIRIDSEEENEERDRSPPRRLRKRSSSSSRGSVSPPRRRRVRSSSSSSRGTVSPPRRTRDRSSSTSESRTASPPRRRRARSSSPESIEKAGEGNGSTIYRDESGRKVDILKEHMKNKASAREQEKEEETIKYEWGMGATEKEKIRENLLKLEEAKQESLAIYADDKKLNDAQRQTMRAGDPMAGYFRNVQSDFPKESKNKYSGPPAPPNRFGIKPGYRWDGIDRSNGFEKRLLGILSMKQHIREENHRWSAQDL